MSKKVSKEDAEIFSWEEVLSQIGGVKGAILSGIPVVVFIIFNSFRNFQTAAIFATLVAGLIFLYQLYNREKFTTALGGILGVIISLIIAGKTGDSNNYFLFGMLTAYFYGLVFLVSILVNFPLVGIIRYNGFLPKYKRVWKEERSVKKFMNLATLLWGLLFILKAAIQTYFYTKHNTVELGVIKLITGYPLTVLMGILTFLIIKQADAILMNKYDQESELNSI